MNEAECIWSDDGAPGSGFGADGAVALGGASFKVDVCLEPHCAAVAAALVGLLHFVFLVVYQSDRVGRADQRLRFSSRTRPTAANKPSNPTVSMESRNMPFPQGFVALWSGAQGCQNLPMVGCIPIERSRWVPVSLIRGFSSAPWPVESLPGSRPASSRQSAPTDRRAG